MARLIDADALIETMEFHVTTMSVCSTTIEARAKGEMKRKCIADVANAPTIDAIPVEWLRTQIEEAIDDNETELASDIDWLIRKYKNEQEAR